jgi:CTP:molybdopterin cytidylyltransferase MocA
MGGPKALVRDGDGVAWVTRAARDLAAGGCGPVVVVLGAAAGQARALVPDGFHVVIAQDWDEGMGASLRTGLRTLIGGVGRDGAVDRDVTAALIGLVDTPGVGPAAVARLIDVGLRAGPAALARATYRGEPGHPVLLGRDHWADVAAGARGDAGARDYLRAHPVTLVECSDVADGSDLDTPAVRDDCS